MNNRRRLIVILGAGVSTAPLRIYAQPAKRSAVVGILAAEGRSTAQIVVAAFKQELQKFGYVEGQNLTLHLRLADGKFDLVPGFATELVNLKVDVIVSAGAVTTSALQKATSTIPIVMAGALDPVGSGFVKSLAQPGGNITGLSSLGADIGAKQLDMLLRVAPKLSLVAVLLNPGNPASSLVLKSIQSAALMTNSKILPVEASSAAGIENAFLAMAQAKVGAVIVGRDGLFLRQTQQIAELAD